MSFRLMENPFQQSNKINKLFLNSKGKIEKFEIPGGKFICVIFNVILLC